jgi:hypothetical protein
MAAKVKKGFGFQLYQFLVIYPGFIKGNTGLIILLNYKEMPFMMIQAGQLFEHT